MRKKSDTDTHDRGVALAWKIAPFATFFSLLISSCTVNVQAQSTPGGPISVGELSSRSDAVIVGRVISLQSEWNATRTNIYTRVDVNVDEVLKGGASLTKLSVYQLGGQVGDIGEIVAGSPEFRPQELVLLFLSQTPDGKLRVVDLFQGKFTVEHDPASGVEMAVRRVPGIKQPLDKISLGEAKKLIRAALGK